MSAAAFMQRMRQTDMLSEAIKHAAAQWRRA